MKKFVLILLFALGMTFSAGAMVKGGWDQEQKQFQLEIEPEQKQVEQTEDQHDTIDVEDLKEELKGELREELEDGEEEDDDNTTLWVTLISTLAVGCVTPIAIALINRRKKGKD
jgi:hypothetical protein